MTDNELIAEFMGWKKDRLGFWTGGHYALAFHKSWNELMPVVEKIEDVNVNRLKFHVLITIDGCKIAYREREGSAIPPGEISIEFRDSKIESVYTAVVEFIKWYNKQTP